MRNFLLALLLTLLAGCESEPQFPVLVGPGPVVIGRLSVDSDIAWTRLPSRAPRRFWTVDGPLLDLLLLIDGLEEGQELFFYRPSTGPLFRASASGPELAEFVLGSLRRWGAEALSLDSLRPVTFAGGEGIRVEFRLREGSTGLPQRGLAVGRVVDGRLFMILFYAAEDHYFPTLAPAVERIVGSARIV